MSRFALPAADPHGLRDAARRLQAVGRELHGNGERVSDVATGTLPSWQGTASLLMAARAQQLRRSGAEHERALQAVAQAAGRYADEVEVARTQVRRLNDLWEDAQWRAAADLGGQPPAGAQPVADELASTQAQLERQYLQVTGTLEQDGSALERALSSGDPLSALPGWAAGGIHAANAANKAVATTRRAVAVGRYSSFVWQVSRFYSLQRPAVSGAVLASPEHRALVQALYGKPSTLPVAGRALTVAGRAFLPLTAFSGVRDVITGGGYEGWRDPATRVAGAVGAAGAGALILSTGAGLGLVALGPVGLAVAGAAVVAYGAWSLGSFVDDHRAAIGAFAERAWGAAVDGARATGAAVGRTVAQAREVLAEGAERVADAARTVRDVLTPPRWLVPRVAGLF